MVLRGIAAVAIVVVMPVVGAFVLFWSAVGLRLGGADFDTHIVFPFAGFGGAAIGLLVGLGAAWRFVRHETAGSNPDSE